MKKGKKRIGDKGVGAEDRRDEQRGLEEYMRRLGNKE
jgi:hypothetical protein